MHIGMFYESWEYVVNLFNDYAKILSEYSFPATHGTGIKILSSKKMFHWLPTELAQVKAGNISENLLNQNC